MRWEGGRRSTNIEDRRGMSAGTIGGGGIGMLLLVLAVSCITGTNPLALLVLKSESLPNETMGAIAYMIGVRLMESLQDNQPLSLQTGS